MTILWQTALLFFMTSLAPHALAQMTLVMQEESAPQGNFTVEQGDATRPTERVIEEPQVFAFDLRNPQIPLERLHDGGVVPDGISTLLFPDILPIKDAKGIKDDDFVIGVVVNGEARAYPVKTLNWHGGVNDFLGATPLFVQWDALSGSALAFNRLLEGTELTFGHSGFVLDSSAIYYDRVTRSLFSPLLGRGITGSFAGISLDFMPVFLTYWKEFKNTYPNGSVLNPKTGFDRPYQTHPLGSYPRDTKMLFPTAYHNDALPRKEPVYGIVLSRGPDTVAVAFSMNALVEQRKGTYEFRFGKERIPMAIEIIPPTGRVRLMAPEGVQVRGLYAYWFVWAAFHPQTLVVKELPAPSKGVPLGVQ